MPTRVTILHEYDQAAREAGRTEHTTERIVPGDRNTAGDQVSASLRIQNQSNQHHTQTVIKTEEIK